MLRRLSLLVAILLAGCSFPDVEIVAADDVGGDAGDDGAAADATVDADVDAESDADGDATTGDDADAADALPSDANDAKTDVEACESGNTCDCDGDGDDKPGPGCGGSDCDDGDSRRNSKVTDYQSHSVDGTTHGGDWNCNGTVEREFKDGVNCGGITLGGAACTSAAGYKQAAPKCGTSATYVTCKISTGILCVEASSKTVTVKCK